MKKYVLFFLMLFSSALSARITDILHENPWEVLRYKFITYPEKKANSWLNLGLKTVSGGIGASSTFALGKFLHAYAYEYDFKFWPITSGKENLNNDSILNWGSFYSIFPISIFSGLLSYALAGNVLLKKYQKNQLNDFLENWEEFKKHVPETLVNKLEIAHKAFIKNKYELLDQADEILEVIVSEINLHFYGDPKGRSFFDLKIFNTNLILDLARIIEACINGYKVYKQPGTSTNNNHSRI